MIVYRVQDRKGRGPFKPGMSKRWADQDFAPGMQAIPTLLEEFGEDILDREGLPGEWFGSAVTSPQGLLKWFSPTEWPRLYRLGYRPVQMFADRILAESENQVLFARRRPLYRQVRVIPWPNTLSGGPQG